MRALLDLFRPGQTIYVPGASSESLALTAALAREPKRMARVHVVSCLLPGFNSFDYAALAPDASLTVFFRLAALDASFKAGRVRLLPLAYSQIAAYLGARTYDVAIAHTSPPDSAGRCSLSICADFTPITWTRAKTRVLVVNPRLPAVKNGPFVNVADADILVEAEAAPIVAASTPPSAEIEAIAARVAKLVPDGAIVQTGIGGAPSAIWAHLSNHRDLTLHSGMVGDGVTGLHEAGVLAANGAHCIGSALGDEALYKYLAAQDWLRFASVAETHDVGALARREKFTAINSALEVDLFGQANLEWQGGQAISGVGGAPDFARAAMLSPGGRSIIALPSTAKGGAISRIVPRINAPTVSLPRNFIDTVVTEHGVAELRDKSVSERADALIQIAAPERREELAAAWREAP